MTRRKINAQTAVGDSLHIVSTVYSAKKLYASSEEKPNMSGGGIDGTGGSSTANRLNRWKV